MLIVDFQILEKSEPKYYVNILQITSIFCSQNPWTLNLLPSLFSRKLLLKQSFVCKCSLCTPWKSSSLNRIIKNRIVFKIAAPWVCMMDLQSLSKLRWVLHGQLPSLKKFIELYISFFSLPDHWAEWTHLKLSCFCESCNYWLQLTL